MTVLLTGIFLGTLAAIGVGVAVLVHRLYGLLTGAARIGGTNYAR